MSTCLRQFGKRGIIAALAAILILSSAVYAVPAQAQGIPGCPIRVTMYATLYVYGGPTFGSAVTTTLVTGKVACLIGRNASTTWIQLALPPEQGGTGLGWSPASAFTVNVPLTVLSVTDGSATPPVVTPPPATSQTYVVKAGDTLFLISQRFGVTLTALIQANNAVPPYIIYVGQVLIIPGTSSGTTPPAGYTKYVVKTGEYLVSIARQYGLSWWTLATINGIGYPYIIYPGQTLLIPAS
jgi:LysM repeat protein